LRISPKKKTQIEKPATKIPVLISYAYLRKAAPEIIEWWASQPELEVIVDSGAYTAWASGDPIDVADYIAWLKDWGHRFWRYFALDVVKEPKPTRQNLFKMWDAGLDPVPVHVFGEDEAWMNELYEHTDFIAVVIRQQMGDPDSFIRRVLPLKMQWAAGRKVHWFGYTNHKQITKWKPYSCDTSSWASGTFFGTAKVYYGKGRWKAFCHADTINGPMPKILGEALREYGYSYEKAQDANLWKRVISQGLESDEFIPHWITVNSWIKFVRDIKKHFGTDLYLALLPASWSDNELVFRAFSGQKGRC